MPNTGAAPASSTSPCKIINKTDYDLVALSPQGVGILDLVVKTSTGSAVIPKNSTATLNLDPNVVYDLILSKSDTLFPVANRSAMADLTTNLFADQTITSTDADQMTSASTFEQMISAYPSSPLATNYQAALTAANNAAATASGPDAVDAFFKNTKGYQNVTGDAVTAVTSYFNQLPSVWAEFTDSVTYYLYSSNGTATSFAGTLAVSISGAIDLTKPNGGYTCTFAPAKNGTDTTKVDVDSTKAKKLTYSNGLFVDDPNSDTPGVALSGNFQLKSKLSQDPADAAIITVITGTLAGVTVLGFDSEQLSNDPDSSFWSTLFNPKGSQQIFNSIMTLAGFLVTILCLGQFVYGGIKTLKNKISPKAKGPTTQELIEKQTEELKKELTAKVESAVKKLAHDPNAKPELDPKAALQKAGVASDQVAAQGDKIQLQKSLASQAEVVEKLAAKEGVMTKADIQNLTDSAKELRTSNQALNTANVEQLPDVVKAQKPIVQDLQLKTETMVKDVSAKLGAQEKAQINSATETAKTAVENQKAVDEQESAKEPGSEGEIESVGEDLADIHI
jgi:hypothetical protein